MATALFGLIGFPLTHSYSPKYFNEKFYREGINADYRAFELTDILEFPSLLKDHPELKGLNVTIPYKQQVIPFLDGLSDAAMQINAVNCIDIRDGKLIGYNTDVVGFEKSLHPLLQPSHKKALILGTGGASKAVQYVLSKLNIEFLLVSRSKRQGTITYHDLDEEMIRENLLIINTTPLGMSPNTDSCPDIPYDAISKDHLLYDLIYNPEYTEFLNKGKAKGATIKSGEEMWHLQAEASWEIWNK